MPDLFKKALDADQDFDHALRIQFGSSATRWNHQQSEYNVRTLQAYQAKIAADRAWLDHLSGKKEKK